MSAIREVQIERVLDGIRVASRDPVVVEAPLELRARGGVPVATIMRTPGHDRELVRGLLHAESIVATITASADDHVELDVEPAAFAARGLLSTAACGVCGRVAIADLELRAREVVGDGKIAGRVLAGLPAVLRASQAVFERTGGLHAAGLFTLDGTLLALREDVGRHNALDKLVGSALAGGLDPATTAIVVSGRLGYELVQKCVRFGAPILAAVSAPSSLAVELGERFGVCVAGFVRGDRYNLYSHAWRVT